MLKLPPVARLSVGLTLLTVSLLLLADLLGVMPNTQQAELQTRKVLTELLAVRVSDNINKGNSEVVLEDFDAFRARYKEISSLGLRLNDDSLLYVSGEHVSNWQSLYETRSTSRFVQVPVYRNAIQWAQLEIAFHQTPATLMGFLTSQKTTVVVLLVGVFGFLVNWIFLRRALSELDPSSVIPGRVAAAFNVLAEGLVMLDRSGRIVLCNTAFEQKSSLDSEHLVGLRLSDLNWTPADGEVKNEDFQYPWITLLESGLPEQTSQLTLKTQTGESLLFAVNSTSISTPDGVVRGAVVTFDDVTELANKNLDLERLVDELKYSQREISRKNHELEILATRDPLTGSLNRRSLFEKMEKLQSENRESGRVLSCIMVDIDHFKSINDNYGHAVGDDVIVMLFNIMNDVSDSTCLVGRYGGEEFVVALPGFTEEDAAQVAEKMRVTLEGGSYYLKSMPSKITASFGVSIDSEGIMSPGELVDLADKGLYVAKESGRNQVVRHSLRDTYLATSDEVTQNSTIELTPGLTDVENIADKHDSQNDIKEPRTNDSTNEVVSGELETTTALVKNVHHNGLDAVLTDRILQGIGRGKRQNTHVVVVLIEVTVQEPIGTNVINNDTGRLTQDISVRLKKILRATDTVLVESNSLNSTTPTESAVAKYVIVLPDVVDVASVIWVVHRLSEEMKLPTKIGLNTISLHTKMGVSVYPADGEEPTSLLANARRAISNENNSLDHFISYYFNQGINELAEKTFRLESELKLAIARNEFSLFYQPMIELDTGRIAGFEVWVRWKSAIHGLVPPSLFIPIAEKTGAIDAIGRWIFQNAASQLSQWKKDGFNDLQLSINVSVINFRTPDFMEYVSTTIINAGLLPKNITIELTEKSLINDLEYSAEIIDMLHDSGYEIALDDFGTGYSSLVHLKNYAFDAVKIDRSFFEDFPANARDTSLIKAIISLSRSLGLKIVAEGVDTLLQLQVLMKLHCDVVQGYVFSEPLSRAQASSLLLNPKAIKKKVNSIRATSNQTQNYEDSENSGLFNRISAVDITALANAKNQAHREQSPSDSIQKYG